MISLEQFHENIWKMFFSSKKTLEEALDVYESMSIESKAMISMMAFRKDEGKIQKDKDGNETIVMEMTPEEIEKFTLLCKQKEQEGYFDNDVADEKIKEAFDATFSEKKNQNSY